MPAPGNSTHVERDTWNDTAVQLAWAPPPYDQSRGLFVYMASKVAAEEAFWEFASERKPHFTASTWLPREQVLGQPLGQGSAAPAEGPAMLGSGFARMSGDSAALANMPAGE